MKVDSPHSYYYYDGKDKETANLRLERQTCGNLNWKMEEVLDQYESTKELQGCFKQTLEGTETIEIPKKLKLEGNYTCFPIKIVWKCMEYHKLQTTS